MFIKKSSLGRVAALASLVLFVSLGLTSCQPASPTAPVSEPPKTETPAETPEVTSPAGPQLPEGVSLLSENDPICGDFTGNFGSGSFYTDIAYATACSATNIDDVTGKETDSYFTFSTYDYLPPDYAPVLVNKYFDKDSNPIYVVYNTFDDSNEPDVHSGVILFKTHYSPYRTPETGAYYGVKFQFLTAGKTLPETRTKSTVYTNDLYIEGGYNADASYNNVTDLATAVEMFAFDNTDYYSAGSWCWDYSGATKQ